MGRNNLKHLPQFQETLNNLRNTLDYDASFADSMRNRRIVLGYTFTNALETLQDAEIGKLEAKREKYASIRQGMMQQLLTGKIRLI